LLLPSLDGNSGEYEFALETKVMSQMASDVITILQDVEAGAKQYAAHYAPPRVAPGRFQVSHEVARKLSDALSKMPALALPDLKYSTWSMTAPFTADNMAAALIERVIDGVSASQALTELVELVSSKTAKIYALKAIAGVTMEGVIELEAGVAVMPAADAPPSLARETMFDISREGSRLYRGSVVTKAPPQAALIIRGQMTVIHAAERNLKEHQDLTAYIVSRQERALASLALSGGGCAPYVVSESSWINHPAYPYSGFGGGGFGTHHGVFPTMGGAVDSGLAVEFYEKLGTMKDAERAVLFRATERLARSRSHPLKVDQAIDLGIAAEMIFLHEMSGDRGELRFRTALRAAWLLGKDGKDRRAVFDCMRKAYDARSAAVHTGALADERFIEILKLADGYCAEAMRLLIRRGGLPTAWDALVLDESEVQPPQAS
jgi:hypothetical protein